MRDGVGPVLEEGEIARAIVVAIRASNSGVVVVDRGAYLRVLVPGRCAVSRAQIERALGKPFKLPGALEQVMTSFRGRFEVDEDRALWVAP